MISFFSNFISEHQIPFSNAMFKATNGQYRFVATEPMSEERKKQGFVDKTDDYAYVIKSYECEENYKEAMRLGLESDVVIIGSAPEKFIEERLRKNKLTIRYAERFFKEGRWKILDPRVLYAKYIYDIRFRKKNVYMLCCSAYTALDCRFIHAYPNKTYKWAYFTDIHTLPLEIILQKKNTNVIKLLWVGRFIKWKHPEEVIELAKKLKEDRQAFEIEMIGIGSLRNHYEELVKKEQLEDVISFEGPIRPEQVMEKMQAADIFMITSDHNEGWGAVVNESMTNACAVIGCREVGSVPFLIDDGINGLIYDKHGEKSLYSCVNKVIYDENFRNTIQKNAYETMQTLWNAEIATERLLQLIHCINTGEEFPYTTGPCSRA